MLGHTPQTCLSARFKHFTPGSDCALDIIAAFVLAERSKYFCRRFCLIKEAYNQFYFGRRFFLFPTDGGRFFQAAVRPRRGSGRHDGTSFHDAACHFHLMQQWR